MCLAVPGKILSVTGEDPVRRVGKVDFGGVVKEVNLAFIPDAQPGEYVIVHVGFAISKLDAEEANRIFEYLNEIEEAGRQA